jgi:hypothetical protein
LRRDWCGGRSCELDLDATKVAANASLASLQPRFAVEARLAQRCAATDDEGEGSDGSSGPDGEGGGDAPVALPVALTDEARAELTERATTRQDWIGHAGRPNRNVTRGADRRTADFRVSPTDPDATPMPFGPGRTHFDSQEH